MREWEIGLEERGGVVFGPTPSTMQPLRNHTAPCNHAAQAEACSSRNPLLLYTPTLYASFIPAFPFGTQNVLVWQSSWLGERISDQARREREREREREGGGVQLTLTDQKNRIQKIKIRSHDGGCIESSGAPAPAYTCGTTPVTMQHDRLPKHVVHTGSLPFLCVCVCVWCVCVVVVW
jgi:hypothetical protein